MKDAIVGNPFTTLAGFAIIGICAYLLMHGHPLDPQMMALFAMGVGLIGATDAKGKSA